MWLIVYKCTDDGEEEACFLHDDFDFVTNYCRTAKPPEGFENRPGYYFYEDHP